MGVKFLSEEWTRQLAQTLNASEAFRQAAGRHSVKIQQVIGGSGGEQRYWLTLDEGTIDMGVGEVEAPDAVITQDYETAVALARGELGAVAAFMSGKIRIDGNLMLLMQLQGALSELGAGMRSLDVEY